MLISLRQRRTLNQVWHGAKMVLGLLVLLLS
ncbi:hypothetical protein SAMN04489732_12961 [Amycolatopsis saalfeldensis]|uniref:Uncharacterized protein n=1 Tax=Amycolatopsis saalfeldensis TaxID=394193 RepID=A0A1H8YNA1_9PSEU|nr:hypothetical protein SAMN04489732_12961 [Amycolatopsis saalfeldensis]